MAGPLKQFQTTQFTKAEFLKLVSVINSRLGEHKLQPKNLETVFEKWWPDLNEQVASILEKNNNNDAPIRPDRDLLVEILELSRAAAKAASPALKISSRAIEDALQHFIELHESLAVEELSNQELLGMLRKMEPALNHIASRYKKIHPSLDTIKEQFDKLDYITRRSTDSDDDDDDIPF